MQKMIGLLHSGFVKSSTILIFTQCSWSNALNRCISTARVALRLVFIRMMLPAPMDFPRDIRSWCLKRWMVCIGR